MSTYEIIDVLNRQDCVDGRGTLRRYSTADGRPLATGFYVVCDPAPAGELRFDHGTLYHGPYPFELTSRPVLEQEVRSWPVQDPRSASCPAAPRALRFAVDWQL